MALRPTYSVYLSDKFTTVDYFNRHYHDKPVNSVKISSIKYSPIYSRVACRTLCTCFVYALRTLKTSKLT